MAIQNIYLRNVINIIRGTFSSVLANYKDAVKSVFTSILVGLVMFMTIEVLVLLSIFGAVLGLLILYGTQEIRIVKGFTDLYYSGELLGITAWRAHLFLSILCFLASTKND